MKAGGPCACEQKRLFLGRYRAQIGHDGIEIVLPRYARHKYEGLLNTLLLSFAGVITLNTLLSAARPPVIPRTPTFG